MAIIRCEACGNQHYFTADMLEVLVKQLHAGNGHMVSRDFPARWEGINDGEGKVTQVRAICLNQIPGITPKEPKRIGRPRKNVASD